MKFSSFAFVILAHSVAPSISVPDYLEYVGPGNCQAADATTGAAEYHDYTWLYTPSTLESCNTKCLEYPEGLRGFTVVSNLCWCFYEDEYAPGGSLSSTPSCPSDISCQHAHDGVGEIMTFIPGSTRECWKYTSVPGWGGTEATGDPHFRTWKNENFEFHGQCDVVMASVKNFAGQGIDLDIHLRTSMVRYWSYIKSAAIRIGNDILEVEGSAAKEDGEDKLHYKINFEYRGPLTEIGGFPVTISPRNNKYTIDLDSKYPGQKIEIKTFKEFVSVKIIGANEDSFGNAVGITGDFKTGKTLARDGHTVLHDFNDLGLEWQVLPSDGKLFQEMARPQFPELCYLPEDPRGDRVRRLAESDITEEAAEAACAGLKDEFDRKGCIYDIMATQDLDMVGAY